MKAVRALVSILSIFVGAVVAVLGNFDFATAYSYGFAVYEFRYEIILLAVLFLILANLSLVGKILGFPFRRLVVGGYDPKSQQAIYVVAALLSLLLFLAAPMHLAVVNWLKYRALYVEHEFKEDYADFLDHAAVKFYAIGNMDRSTKLWAESNQRRETSSAIVDANIKLVEQRQEISRQLSQNAIAAEGRMGDFNLVAYQLYAQALLFSGDNDVAETATERYRSALTRASTSADLCANYRWFVLGRIGDQNDCENHLSSVDHTIKWQADEIGKLLAERRRQQFERPSGSQLLISFRQPDSENVGIVRIQESFITRYLRRLAAFGFVGQDLYKVVDQYDF